jgi:soluble lytic murein transglycosylase-like protein
MSAVMTALMALLVGVNVHAQEPLLAASDLAVSDLTTSALSASVLAAAAGAKAEELGRILGAAARLYGLDPALLAAIAQVESNGDPGAVSPKGAQGLMQLMPATARRFGVESPLDPIDNTLGAARFLSHLKRWQASRPDLALNLPELIAAYNAGEGAVEKYRGIPPYAETRQYVRKVLLTYLMARPSSEPALPALSLSLDPRLMRRVALEPAHDAFDQLKEIRRRRELALSRPQPSTSR